MKRRQSWRCPPVSPTSSAIRAAPRRRAARPVRPRRPAAASPDCSCAAPAAPGPAHPTPRRHPHRGGRPQRPGGDEKPESRSFLTSPNSQPPQCRNSSITPRTVTSDRTFCAARTACVVRGRFGARETEAPMAGAGFETLKALIVEDNAHMRTLLRALLNSAGIKEIAEAGQWPGRARPAARAQIRPGAQRPGDEADGRAGIHPPRAQ